MRARTITTIVVLGALAIPVSASAAPIDYASPNAITGGSGQSTQPAEGSGQSSVNAITQGSGTPSAPSSVQSAQPVDPGHPAYSSLNATAGSAGQPTAVASSPSSGGEGFDWPSALVGAGAAMALAALGAAAFVSLRRPASAAETG
jgi:hypothetical protein